jgi:peroxiredoxin
MKMKMLALGLLLGLFLTMPELKAQNVGEKAPDFSYTDLEGGTHTLSQYLGKVVFLYSFGNQCPFCEEAGPDTETKVNQVYGQREDFQALGLDTWPNSTVATVGQFRVTTGITYPLLLNAASFENLYSTTYDRALVVDKEGVLRYKGTSRVKGDLNNAIAVIESLFMTTDVSDPDGRMAPGLSPVFPNPSRDFAQLRFVVDGQSRVSVRIFNPIGQEVMQVLDERLPAGEHSRQISTLDLGSGIYLVHMEASGKTYTRKMQVSR